MPFAAQRFSQPSIVIVGWKRANVRSSSPPARKSGRQIVTVLSRMCYGASSRGDDFGCTGRLAAVDGNGLCLCYIRANVAVVGYQARKRNDSRRFRSQILGHHKRARDRAVGFSDPAVGDDAYALRLFGIASWVTTIRIIRRNDLGSIALPWGFDSCTFFGFR